MTSPRRVSSLHQLAQEPRSHPLPLGIIFLDLFPILQDPIAFEMLITTFMNHIFSVSIPTSPSTKVDVVVGLDARCVLRFVRGGRVQSWS
mgnify:CR=1 FL=1